MVPRTPPPRPHPPRSRQRRERREAVAAFRQAEILVAARRVFAAHGFAAASMEAIAVEAGIAKGTLYLYFPGKEEIFWAAVNSRCAELLRRMRRELKTARGAQAQLAAAVRVRFEFLQADESFLRIYATEFGHLAKLGSPHAAPFRRIYRRGAELLAEVIAAGVRSGELRAVAPLPAALALLDLTRDVFTQRFLGMRPGRDFDGAAFVTDLFLRGLAPAGAAGGEKRRKESQRHDPSA